MPFYEAPKPALPHPHRSRFVQCLFVHHFLGRWGVKELIESDKDSHGMHAGFVVHSKDLFLFVTTAGSVFVSVCLNGWAAVWETDRVRIYVKKN